MPKLLALVDAGKVKAVIVAKLDRLTRSVKDLCELLECFERKGIALVSVAESLDTGSARPDGWYSSLESNSYVVFF
jgi:site-specific DNA recombinase